MIMMCISKFNRSIHSNGTFFFSAELASGKSYKAMSWLMQIAAFGMLLSFPFQSYASVSISFRREIFNTS